MGIWIFFYKGFPFFSDYIFSYTFHFNFFDTSFIVVLALNSWRIVNYTNYMLNKLNTNTTWHSCMHVTSMVAYVQAHATIHRGLHSCRCTSRASEILNLVTFSLLCNEYYKYPCYISIYYWNNIYVISIIR